ncbi:MAG: sugar ABC transporter permease, partial [Clostridia bacterium]|nr:sugar ABC transporter permease [Clostridia bacterium]
YGQNYVEMWSDRWFTASLKNTLIFAFSVVPVTVFLALVLAVIIDRYCWGKTPIKLAVFMPYISNIVAVAIVWVMMYSPWGPFTQLVKLLGWENPPAWLGDYTWALPAVILMSIWSGVGYCILIYSSSIQGLPQDVYEAADVDGANELTKFLRITVPALSPTTFFLVITTLITSFQVFAPIQIMTRGGPGTSTHVLVYYIYTAAFSFYRMGYASAISWILFLLLLIVTLIQWRGQQKWVSYQ